MAKLKPREFITPDRIKEIKQEIAELEKSMVGGDDNRSDGVGFMSHTVNQIQDPGAIKHQIRQKKKILEAGTPKPFENQRDANKAYEWAKKAERWIKEHAPQGNDVQIRYPNPGREEHDFSRGVDKMVAWLEKGDKVYSTYRYIMRRLDPSNPNAGRIRGI